MSTTEPSATERTGTAEDVELLATRLMGWRLGRGGLFWFKPDGEAGAPTSWNPFTSADADVQVLERVREGDWWKVRVRGTITAMDSFWMHLRREWASRTGVRMEEHNVLCATGMSYFTGDYSRAALAVLKEMEKTEEGR